MQSADYENGLHPEIAEASPFYQYIADAGGNLMGIGFDANTAIAIVAATPVLLKLLKIIGDVVSASLTSWQEDKRLERKRREYEMNREFEKTD